MGNPLNGWHSWIEDGLNVPEMASLWDFLNGAYEKVFVFPEPEKIFEAFVLCPLDKLKVLIVGQDPYHTEYLAHGLAFSVPETEAIPPSLRNIYKELERDLGIKRTSGDLSDWARQGVLLLNPVLTVEEGKPASHENRGWERFTGQLLAQASKSMARPLIAALWGRKAQCWAEQYLSKKDIILSCSHPSPLGVSSGKTPFKGCGHFSMINDHLRRLGQKPINWGQNG
jgi:uracil-DNA glycosylase